METKAKITGFSVDHLNNKIRLEIESDNAEYAETVEALQKGDIRLNMKQWREKRSLNANALFYLMVDKLADALRVSKPYIHNLLLRKYGQLQKIDDRPIWVILPENEDISKRVDEDDSLHLKPTSEVKIGKDGRAYRTYLMLKGSHELDTKGMAVLLDGTLDEARQAGIDTMNPQEVERIKKMWGVEFE